MGLMISNRIKPWDTLGIPTPNATNVDQALHEMGMDWEVLSRPILVDSGDINRPYLTDPRFVANVRSDTNEIIAVVSDKYEVVQNRQGMSFIDYLMPEGFKITRGGMINNKKLWVVGEYREPRIIEDDKVNVYAIFTLTHDGKGSIRACVSPINPACQNALPMAFSKSYRSWAISHVGDVQGKLRIAEDTMRSIGLYMDRFVMEGIKLKNISLTDSRLEETLAMLFPLEEDANVQKENIVLERRDTVKSIFKNAPDLGRGTAWDFVNAVSDYATHYIPSYNEQLYRTSNLSKIIKGHPLIDSAYKLVA